jgi:hypothetical protein
VNLRTLFSNPSAEFRSVPFWSWNDKLDSAEIAWQVKQMKEQGMGGFFMHSRDGLETEYLGDEWMRCIKTAVETARQEGMAAWLYDEDRWPSGAAGGLVTKRGDAFRLKALTIELSSTLPQEEMLAVLRGKVSGNKLISLRGGKGPLQEKEQYLLFRQELAEKDPWYNDQAPADILNPEAVRAFIEITHEAYFNRVGKDFGTTVPGIFTDEPSICGIAAVKSGRRFLPWTAGFAEYFRQRRGYDFFSVAPYLFLDGEASLKTRHDFWYTITERFVSAYSRQLGEWCQTHGIAFTGHYLSEDNLGGAIWGGGAVMPHYCQQQLPGIDLLTEETTQYLTVKQCTSVANQLGKKRVLTETYGCTGWEFTFEGQKWIGDWQYVMGVNLRCQHLTLYSLRGCRKRDFPGSFNYHTTWWRENKVVEDYFARLSAVLTQGKPVRELLVLHPQTTAWSRLYDQNLQEINAFGKKLNDLAQQLLARKCDFDFGDELVLADFGKVKDEVLQVGETGYKAVLIPRCATLLASTVSLLAEFLRNGGKMLILGDAPGQVEARPDPKLAALWRQAGVFRAETQAELFVKLEELLPARVKIADKLGLPVGSILCMERQLEDKAIYFLVNNDRQRAWQVEIQLPAEGKVNEFDALTGEIQPVACKTLGRIAFHAEFAPAASKLYVVELNSAPEPVKPEQRQSVESYELGPLWSRQRTMPNILPLDVCAWRFERETWSEFKPLWQAQYQLRERLGMRQVHVNGIQQRYLWVREPHPQDGAKLELLFKFTVAKLPENLELILECGDFQVSLNGRQAGEPEGWLLDKAMKRISLPGVRLGENQLLLKCRYYNWMELEDCFLAGDFGVDHRNNSITAEPETLRYGDWCLQGYPFYPGSMLYQTTYVYRGQRAFLAVEADAVTADVSVNGKKAGKLPWRQASPLELSRHLLEGENQIQLELFASPRNMLGPLHRRRRHTSWTRAHSFRTVKSDWTDDYVLWPFGLNKATISTRK